MTAPQTESMAKMTAPAAATSKMVKIRAVRDIRLANGTVLKPGQEAKVTEDEAVMFCEHPKADGHFAFSGERPTSEIARHKMVRAERLD